jgi:hypothetical protein
MLVFMFFVVAAICALAALGLQNVAPNRHYKSGTSWCVWRWTKVDSDYIVRLHILKTPWWAVCLHWLKKPDAEPWLHDHPVSFLSIILRGKYGELRQRAFSEPKLLVHRWFNFIRASEYDKHRIVFTRKNTLTLCFMGPKTREWGFHTIYGWVFWKDYYKRQRAMPGAFDLKKAYTDANDAADALTLRFIVKYAGPHTVTDELGRLIDTDPADDFKAEPPTEPRRV